MDDDSAVDEDSAARRSSEDDFDGKPAWMASLLDAVVEEWLDEDDEGAMLEKRRKMSGDECLARKGDDVDEDSAVDGESAARWSSEDDLDGKPAEDTRPDDTVAVEAWLDEVDKEAMKEDAWLSTMVMRSMEWKRGSVAVEAWLDEDE